MPSKLAGFICKNNIRTHRINGELVFETYDGSGQLVHPDLTLFHNRLWMVATPYPYGMEEYENPCTYVGNNLIDLKPECTPVVYQSVHRPGFHLSDPCISHNKDLLFCFYRESKRIAPNKELNTINVIEYNEIASSWGIEKSIVSSERDSLLSPAFLFDKHGRCHMYYVSRVDGEFKLAYSKLDESFKPSETSFIQVEDIPEGFNLWHIGMAFNDNKDKHEGDSQSLSGLFLLKGFNNSFRLFKAESGGLGMIWALKNEIIIDKSLQENINFLYKSSFIPGTDKCLISGADKRNRYFLIAI